MTKNYLIAYGTMSGSTAEVAQAIAEEMQKNGAHVDLQPVEDVKNIEDYDGVVVGSSVRAFNILRKTRRFLRKHRKALTHLPVAYFLVCLTMSENTPETVQQATKFAKPMINTKEPVSLGLFGGCIIHKNMTDMFAKPLRSMPEQDHRDWDQIREWAQATFHKLVEEA
jgi:menaquinone-dependent protoporphyrinogen oxidase